MFSNQYFCITDDQNVKIKTWKMGFFSFFFHVSDGTIVFGTWIGPIKNFVSYDIALFLVNFNLTKFTSLNRFMAM